MDVQRDKNQPHQRGPAAAEIIRDEVVLYAGHRTNRRCGRLNTLEIPVRRNRDEQLVFDGLVDRKT